MTTEVNIDPLNTLNGVVDLESQEAEKIFQEAYAKEQQVPAPTPEPVVEAIKESEVTPAPTEPVVEAKTEPQAVVQTQTEKPSEVSPTAVVDPNAWINKLPDDLKAQAQKVIQDITKERDFAKHQWVSDRERAQALNNKTMKQDREIAELRSKLQTKPQTDPQLAAVATKEANKSLEEWEELVNADPKLARAIEQKANELYEARNKAAIGTMEQIAQERVKQAVAPLQEDRFIAQRENERQLLLKAVPNAQEVISSAQYAYWLHNKASPGMKQIAENSIDHRDVLQLFNVYASTLPQVIEEMVAQGLMQKPEEQKTPAQEQQAATQAQVETSKADKVAAKRAEKLTQAPVVQQAPAAVIPTHTVGPGGIVDLDDAAVDAYFAESFKKHLRTR